MSGKAKDRISCRGIHLVGLRDSLQQHRIFEAFVVHHQLFGFIDIELQAIVDAQCDLALCHSLPVLNQFA